MVQLVTNGIKISVKTRHNGTTKQGVNLFSYYISIENKTLDTVQLIERFWEISDALNDTEIVEGEGVVGQKPILKPNENYTYQSNCLLIASSGSMKGSFKMLNKTTNKYFEVIIPIFQLTAIPFLN